MRFPFHQSVYLCFLLWFVLIKSAGAIPFPADTVTSDYAQAVNHCLFHQYPEAETALLAILRQASHPNRDAAIHLLTEEVYLYRGQYKQYTALADSINYKGGNYTFARLMSSQPPTRITLTDSMTQHFQLKKRGHVVVTLLVNGRPKRFMVDTGAQRTTLSTRLAAELVLPTLVEVRLVNALGQSLPSSVSLLDSIRFGSLQVKHVPVFVQSLWGFGVDGVLGWDILRQFRTTIDYVNSTITLTNPAGRVSAVQNLLGGSRPLLQVQNKTGGYLTLFCDTGDNGRVVLTPQGQTKLTDGRPGHALTHSLGAGGRMRLRRTNAMKQFTIKADGYAQQLRKQSVELPAELISGVLIDGRIGSGFFRTGRLLFDPTNAYYEYRPTK